MRGKKEHIIRMIMATIKKANKLSLTVDEDKLIREVCAYARVSNRTAKEYLKEACFRLSSLS